MYLRIRRVTLLVAYKAMCGVMQCEFKNARLWLIFCLMNAQNRNTADENPPPS